MDRQHASFSSYSLIKRVISIGIFLGMILMMMGCTTTTTTTMPHETDTTLSPTQKNALIALTIEEKIAHDIYTQLGNETNLRVFENIAQAEETHYQTMQTLLTQYNITDPTDETSMGIFPDETNTKLYTSLLNQGIGSTADSISVGIMIEEMDIKDIEEMKPLFSDYPAILQTLNKLQAGSQNHLEAFQRQQNR